MIPKLDAEVVEVRLSDFRNGYYVFKRVSMEHTFSEHIDFLLQLSDIAKSIRIYLNANNEGSLPRLEIISLIRNILSRQCEQLFFQESYNFVNRDFKTDNENIFTLDNADKLIQASCALLFSNSQYCVAYELPKRPVLHHFFRRTRVKIYDVKD